MRLKMLFKWHNRCTQKKGNIVFIPLDGCMHKTVRIQNYRVVDVVVDSKFGSSVGHSVLVQMQFNHFHVLLVPFRHTLLRAHGEHTVEHLNG